MSFPCCAVVLSLNSGFVSRFRICVERGDVAFYVFVWNGSGSPQSSVVRCCVMLLLRSFYEFSNLVLRYLSRSRFVHGSSRQGPLAVPLRAPCRGRRARYDVFYCVLHVISEMPPCTLKLGIESLCKDRSIVMKRRGVVEMLRGCCSGYDRLALTV
jgi:hypothetical protein